MDLLHHWWFIPLGFGVGAYGTLIGVGGGFVLVPVLMLMFPDWKPDLITAISLVVVFCNASSGSVTYARMKRIDYRSALMFGAATIPGSIIGGIAVQYVDRTLFNIGFGVILTAGSLFVVWQSLHPAKPRRERPNDTSRRTIVESDGTIHTYSFDPMLGIVISVFVGFLSAMLGIGGGIVHVPSMVRLLGFPVHMATATSHLVLVISTATTTVVHIFQGVFSTGLQETIYLSIGVLFGAPLGALLSRRIHGDWIMRGLAIALACVGIRLLAQPVWAAIHPLFGK
jgi:hypothetical protein